LVLLGLDLRNRIDHLPQAAALARNLSLQAGQQGVSVGRAQLVEPLAPIPPYRSKVADALGH
jgi:hypothetical protein